MNEQKELYENLKGEKNLDKVQAYIKDVITIRKFSDQPVEQIMLLLTEEVGELAKAIRKDFTSMRVDKLKIKNYDLVEEEVADVFIVLCSVCNKLGINLYDALLAKEKVNVERSWN